MNNSVAFIILNYNTAYETCKCIRYLQKLSGCHKKNYIVVDNNSSDSSVNDISNNLKDIKNLKIIKLNSNQGFSRGNNIGYQYAVERINPDFILVINSDIFIKQKNFLSKIYQIYAETNFHILGPDVYVPSEKWHQSPHNIISQDLYTNLGISKVIERFQKDISKYKCLQKQGISTIEMPKVNYAKNILKNGIYSILHIKYKAQQRNVCLHGSALIFSRNFIKSNSRKCFVPEVFYYGEEELLLYRALINNYNVIYDPRIKVFHQRSVSIDRKMGSRNRIDRIIFNLESELESKKTLSLEMEKYGEISTDYLQ